MLGSNPTHTIKSGASRKALNESRLGFRKEQNIKGLSYSEKMIRRRGKQ